MVRRAPCSGAASKPPRSRGPARASPSSEQRGINHRVRVAGVGRAKRRPSTPAATDHWMGGYPMKPVADGAAPLCTEIEAER
jgi:hypothetical protein